MSVPTPMSWPAGSLFILLSGLGLIPLTGISGCPQAGTDADGDGFTVERGDCDDQDPAVSPGMMEACNGRDDDCDGKSDQGITRSYYQDVDEDGYGDPLITLESCVTPMGYTPVTGDCDVTDPATHPGAAEVCDGVDNDCDVQQDEGSVYVDRDGDGFGTDEGGACGEGPAVAARGDCNDGDPATYPGALERGQDGRDQDCGGTDGTDPHVGLPGSTWTSLQAALNAAVPGSTVFVGPGTYLEQNLDFGGKAVALVSTHGRDVTRIDAQGLGRVLLVTRGEGSGTVVDGFTLSRGAVKDGHGAGVYIEASSPTLRGCAISSCVATTGTVSTQGGGIYLKDSEARILDTVITGNDAFYGGGALAWGGSPWLEGLSVADNTGRTGAGFYVVYGTPTLLRSSVTGSLADYDGGGMRFEQSQPVVAWTRVEGNVTSQLGGGLMLSAAHPAITQSIFLDNHADMMDGGAIQFVDSSPAIDHSLFMNNTAAWGGAFYITHSAPTIASSLVVGNVASYPYGSGGAMYLVTDGSPQVEHSVIAHNGAAGAGYAGGVEVQYATSRPIFSHSILAYNAGYNLYVSEYSGSGLGAPTLSYCNLYAANGQGNHNLNSLDATNLMVEPGFLAPGSEAGEYHLDGNATLVNAGSPTERDPDGSSSDLGIYGGPGGAGWDLDGDGEKDWFWPGELAAAPTGYVPAEWDIDDQNPLVR